MAYKIRVWDLPTRVFHWAIVACVIGLVITANLGGSAMEWHFRLGYTVLSLLLFRLVWGFVGGHWSRFRSFIFTPSTVWRYLRGAGKAEHSVGHNPAGAGSVFALLGFLLLQATSGLFTDDEIAAAGPLGKFVSNVVVGDASYYHREIGKTVLIALVVLHIAAIVFYVLRKRQNLVRPMLQGDKELAFEAPGSRDDARSRGLALVLFLACAALVAWTVQLAG